MPIEVIIESDWLDTDMLAVSLLNDATNYVIMQSRCEQVRKNLCLLFIRLTLFMPFTKKIL